MEKNSQANQHKLVTLLKTSKKKELGRRKAPGEEISELGKMGGRWDMQHICSSCISPFMF